MMNVPNVPLDASLNKYSLEYQYSELTQATRNFAEDQRLGKGSFGAVFHGIQSDLTDIAVKVLDGPESTGFMEEVRVLSKFRHPHLVTLMGFARHRNLRFLVYEYLDGGDLSQRIRRCASHEKSFSWTERISVLFDAACGLSHLHNSNPKVFHRDIKSANILLDRNGGAKIADFGLACLSHASTHKVDLTTGTMGYADPLYVQTAIVTEGSEVYSFGMVTLELLTSLPPCQKQQTPDGAQGYTFLKDRINGDIQVVQMLLDREAQWPSYMWQALADFVFTCTQAKQEMRPKFTSIVKLMRSMRDNRETATRLADGKGQRHGASEMRCASLSPAPVRRVSASPRTATPQRCESRHACVGAPGHTSPYRSPEVKESRATTPRMLSPARHATEWSNANAMQVPHASGGSLLWVLECIEAHGTDLTSCRDGKYLIRHVHLEQGKPVTPTLRVGRLQQTDFFTSLIPDRKLFEAVSRDHFHIWAQDTLNLGTTFTFWLSNFSSNGTLVNGQYLRAPGEQIQISEGDIISLPRHGANATEIVSFMSFRFSLAGSILSETVQVDHAVSPTMSEESAGMDTAGDVPEFVLEVGGSGMAQKSGTQNTLRHGLSGSSHCPDFLLGRGQQPEFWKGVLCRRAYEMLSRKHLRFETSKDAPTSKSITYVENLVADKEVFVYNPSKGMTPQDASTVRMNDKLQLQHGDIIILNPSNDCVVWLLFIEGERSAFAKADSLEICASRNAAACILGGA